MSDRRVFAVSEPLKLRERLRRLLVGDDAKPVAVPAQVNRDAPIDGVQHSLKVVK